MKLRRGIFLDRDGVINRNVWDPSTGEYGAPLHADQLVLAPGAVAGLTALQRAEFLLFVVSNQPNHAKGKSSLEALKAVHQRLVAELDAAGVEFSEFFYCYHHPRAVIAEYAGPCLCRKPSPYFLLTARDKFGLSLETSWLIGDRATDIECGRAAAVRTIRLAEDHPSTRNPEEAAADFEARDLAHAAELILAHSQF